MPERTAVHATFTQERSYPAPTPIVFSEWANPQIKARWFAHTSAGYTMDFSPGGVERNCASVGGKQIVFESLYREIVTDERIVYTSVLSEDGAVATVSLTTVEFTTDGDATRVTLVEAGAYLDDREQPEWRERGTGDWLDALGRDLEEHAQRPTAHRS